MLTAEEIVRVRSSFDMVFANATDMTTTFYDRLFELAPEYRPLFPADLSVLKRDFISKLAVLVGSLDQTTGLLAGADLLGRNHKCHTHELPCGGNVARRRGVEIDGFLDEVDGVVKRLTAESKSVIVQ